MNINELLKKKPWLGWVLFLITVVAVFFLGLLASSIIERRSEAVFAYAPQITFPLMNLIIRNGERYFRGSIIHI